MLVAVSDFRDIMQADCLHALHSRFPVLQFNIPYRYSTFVIKYLSFIV